MLQSTSTTTTLSEKWVTLTFSPVVAKASWLHLSLHQTTSLTSGTVSLSLSLMFYLDLRFYNVSFFLFFSNASQTSFFKLNPNHSFCWDLLSLVKCCSWVCLFIYYFFLLVAQKNKEKKNLNLNKKKQTWSFSFSFLAVTLDIHNFRDTKISSLPKTE